MVANPDVQAALAEARARAARLEEEGDLAGAFDAYGEAVALAPQDPGILSSLAALASALGMHVQAAQLWEHLRAADPTAVLPALGHARALVDAAHFAEAAEVLKSVLLVHPTDPRLWTALGLCLTYAGRAQDSLTFFDEAIRLDATLTEAVYHRGLAWGDMGRLDEAEADFRAALALSRSAAERATIEFSLATLLLARGDLAAGWSLYERRLSPDWPRSVSFQGIGSLVTPDVPVGGRSVLVLAEQGVGDEVMFGSLLPDLLAETGSDGRIVLAVEARLVALFQRSFPSIEVLPHATPRVGVRPHRQTREPPGGEIDGWIPLASLAQRYRPNAAAFPRASYLKADPARVEHWRQWLGDRPAVGLTWRRGKSSGESQRRVPRLGDWAELLRIPGVQFVDIQYGDSADDLARLAEIGGVEIRRPPGLDIRDDLDDLAALCSALDAVAGIQNATSVLAGACGTPVVLVAGPDSWVQLGEARPPWFADARLCLTDSFGDWTPAVTAAARELRDVLSAASG